MNLIYKIYIYIYWNAYFESIIIIFFSTKGKYEKGIVLVHIKRKIEWTKI